MLFRVYLLTFAAAGLALAEPETYAEIFAQAEKSAIAPGPDLDRNRGLIVFKAEHGVYDKGGHFGKWHWPEFTGDRWGMYQVEVTYASAGNKMGFQFSIGQTQAKGYLPQSGSMEQETTAILDRLYIPDTRTYAVTALTGEDSNGPTFRLNRVTLRPAPEGDEAFQAIDGTITLSAGQATTFSKRMRYEPKQTKNCLGFWTEAGDWAEWRVSVHQAGDFKLEIAYGCGKGNGGSQVKVWVDDQEHAFTVEETGGFQSWKTIGLGQVTMAKGVHRVTVKPLTKTHKAVLDIKQILLTPEPLAAAE